MAIPLSENKKLFCVILNDKARFSYYDKEVINFMVGQFRDQTEDDGIPHELH